MLVAVLCCCVFQVACGGSSAVSNNTSSGRSSCVPASSATYAGTQPVTYSFSVLHAFTGHANSANVEGGHPYAGMVMDGAGNLYGTTLTDGAFYFGTVFKVDPTGKQTTLHDFTGGADGGAPWGVLEQDEKCNLYGTTTNGGASSRGIVFKLDPAGNLTVLHAFNNADGNSPEAGVIRDASGNLYGMTMYGGSSDHGVAYRLDANGTYTVLHSFSGGTDGVGPRGPLLQDSAGNLWGMTLDGGSSGGGVIFKIDPAGNETIVHTFTGPDGFNPLGGLVQDSAGNLYGTASAGGTQQSGVIFKIDTAGSFTLLYNFDGTTGGGGPWNIVLDAGGNIYGAAGAGDPTCGGDGCGVIYKLDTAGNQTILHSFSFTDGEFATDLMQDAAGNLYGTTMEGGLPACDVAIYGYCGVVFKLTAH